MAYLDVRDAVVAAPVPSAAEPVTGFARREWDVIVLAQKDGLASLYEPSRLHRLAAWLFGGSATRRLADPKLESLRRLAVLAWHHGYAVPMSAIKAFKTAGFSADQLELLLASVSRGRIRYGMRAY
jgi:hypothetical protein